MPEIIDRNVAKGFSQESEGDDTPTMSDRQRYAKRLRARAYIQDRIAKEGFDNVIKSSPGVTLIGAPDEQLAAVGERRKRNRQAQQLYSQSYESDQLDAAYRHIRFLYGQRNQQQQMRTENNAMNERTLWVAPKILSVVFLLTLGILLMMPVETRPTFGVTLLTLLAIALNTSIIPPIANLIIRWNQRRTETCMTERRTTRQF